MASGPMFVPEGEPRNMASDDLNDRRHPRSALAVMPEGKVPMVAVGRRAAKGAAGMNMSDLADPSLDIGILNHPTDNTERDKDGNSHLTTKKKEAREGGFILLLDEKSLRWSKKPRMSDCGMQVCSF